MDQQPAHEERKAPLTQLPLWCWKSTSPQHPSCFRQHMPTSRGLLKHTWLVANDHSRSFLRSCSDRESIKGFSAYSQVNYRFPNGTDVYLTCYWTHRTTFPPVLLCTPVISIYRRLQLKFYLYDDFNNSPTLPTLSQTSRCEYRSLMTKSVAEWWGKTPWDNMKKFWDGPDSKGKPWPSGWNLIMWLWL